MPGTLGVLRGTLELLIMRSLAVEAPMHGFAILDWIRQETDHVIVVEDGALYPALRRMEEKGWLESAWAISEKGRRARYYEMTPLGQMALARQSEEWDRYVAAMARLGPQGA